MTDTTRDLLISLASHMAYMQGQLEARHEFDDPEDYYWYRESVLLRQKVTDALADEPAVPAPPADGEVAELAEWLCAIAADLRDTGFRAERLIRAAELLQRQVLVPVSVSERPWEREGWCDGSGRCWSSSSVLPDVPAWIYGPAAWAERFPDIHRLLLPAHALPLPEVNND